jgi:hypothetical protein
LRSLFEAPILSDFAAAVDALGSTPAAEIQPIRRADRESYRIPSNS